MNGGNNRCVTTIIIRHLSQVLLYKIGISRRNSYQKICSFIGIAVRNKILCKLQSDCYTVFVYSALGSVLHFVISMNILQDVRIGRSISVSLIFQVVSKFLPRFGIRFIIMPLKIWVYKTDLGFKIWWTTSFLWLFYTNRRWTFFQRSKMRPSWSLKFCKIDLELFTSNHIDLHTF